MRRVTNNGRRREGERRRRGVRTCDDVRRATPTFKTGMRRVTNNGREREEDERGEDVPPQPSKQA